MDDEDDLHTSSSTININKPLPNFPPKTKETYVGWVVNLTLPDPVDNRFLPMYPKSRVYADPTTEYSLEELAALRYPKTMVSNLSSYISKGIYLLFVLFEINT